MRVLIFAMVLFAQHLSASTLTLDQVLKAALASNKDIKTKLASVEVSRASMQEFRAAEFPVFGFGVSFPVASPNAQTAYDLRATQNIDSLISLPSRIDASKAAIASSRYNAAAEISRLLSDVKIAYYKYQAALEMQSLWQVNLRAAQASSGLAKAQRKAGNISTLDSAQNLSFQKLAKLELARAQSQAAQCRNALVQLMGLSSDDKSWEVPSKLMGLPKESPDFDTLKQEAASGAPQPVALRGKVEANRLMLSSAKAQLFPHLNIGISAVFDPEGNKNIGPFIELGFPFFGKPKAQVRKARAELKESEISLAAYAHNTEFTIAALIERMTLARNTVELYQNEVFPLQERIANETLKQYNYMLLSAYQLLSAKQNYIKAKQDELQARLDYWLASTELELLTKAFSYDSIESPS